MIYRCLATSMLSVGIWGVELVRKQKNTRIDYRTAENLVLVAASDRRFI